MSAFPKLLVETANIVTPLVGLYDAPDPTLFEPVAQLKPDRWACVFMFYKRWLKGHTLHLTPDNFGCPGAGTYLFNLPVRSREEYIDFLHGHEGLKADRLRMAEWIDQCPRFSPRHGSIFLGPVREEAAPYLKTVTFFVNPDQLSLLITAVWHGQGALAPPRLEAPFASGCGLMGPWFDQEQPLALLGATDIAMRKYLPRDILAVTVNPAMYMELCGLDESSFLGKRFWRELDASRRQS
ncbi:MAG: hypothetical protein D6E12_06745 [Desulfovibrio sp.]|nr:MAG: hypothetical protein D6E12_06745 [Desulfovibrio sp.]